MRGNIKVVQNKIIARKRKQLIYKVIFTVFFLAVAFFGAGWLSQLSVFEIQNVRVQGPRQATILSVEAIARQEITGSYWYIFARNNIFIYPKRAILDRVAESTLVQNVYIETEGLHTINIIVKERAEAMLWCDDGVNALCFFADENGYIYEQSARGDSDVTDSATSTPTPIIFRGALAGGPIGEYIMPGEGGVGGNGDVTVSDFKRIQFFLSQLGALGVDVREVVIGETSYITVRLAGHGGSDGSGARLIINSIDDLSAVLSNLKSVLEKNTIASSSEAFIDNLDYMRLDSGNKIFYKVKGSSQ